MTEDCRAVAKRLVEVWRTYEFHPTFNRRAVAERLVAARRAIRFAVGDMFGVLQSRSILPLRPTVFPGGPGDSFDALIPPGGLESLRGMPQCDVRPLRLVLDGDLESLAVRMIYCGFRNILIEDAIPAHRFGPVSFPVPSVNWYRVLLGQHLLIGISNEGKKPARVSGTVIVNY